MWAVVQHAHVAKFSLPLALFHSSSQFSRDRMYVSHVSVALIRHVHLSREGGAGTLHVWKLGTSGVEKC